MNIFQKIKTKFSNFKVLSQNELELKKLELLKDPANFTFEISDKDVLTYVNYMNYLKDLITIVRESKVNDLIKNEFKEIYLELINPDRTEYKTADLEKIRDLHYIFQYNMDAEKIDLMSQSLQYIEELKSNKETLGILENMLKVKTERPLNYFFMALHGKETIDRYFELEMKRNNMQDLMNLRKENPKLDQIVDEIALMTNSDLNFLSDVRIRDLSKSDFDKFIQEINSISNQDPSYLEKYVNILNDYIKRANVFDPKFNEEYISPIDEFARKNIAKNNRIRANIDIYRYHPKKEYDFVTQAVLKTDEFATLDNDRELLSKLDEIEFAQMLEEIIVAQNQANSIKLIEILNKYSQSERYTLK